MSWFLIVRNFKLLEPYEGKLSRTVLRGESSRKGTDLPGKVKETIEMVSEISKIYATSYNKMLTDKNFTVAELEAIGDGYSKLLKESGNLLSDIKQIVTPSNGLSLSDAERMDVIDKIHAKMAEYRNLTKYYSQRSMSISYIRSQEKGDMERVRALYGDPSERYW